MSHERLNIVIADDDPAMLKLVGKWVGAAGFDVRLASDGLEAMDLITAKCPDVLVIDWEMPGLTGLQLARWVRNANFPNYVYTLVITARCGKNDVLEAFEAGVDDYLKKPIDKDELVARILSGQRTVERERKLLELSRNDAVTGLLHRSTLMHQIEMEWSRCTRFPIAMNCVLLEIDHLSDITQRLGDAGRNQLLRQVAETLREDTRECDALGSLANYRFLALLTEADEQGAHAWAKRMQQRVRGIMVPTLGNQGLPCSVSIGLAQRTAEMESPPDLLRCAEEALKSARAQGGDNIAIYARGGDPLASLTRNELLRAYTAGQIMNHAVPKLHLTDSAEKARRFLLRFQLDSLVVIDDHERYVGMLSDRELLRSTIGAADDTKLGDLLIGSTAHVSETSTAFQVYRHFCEASERSLVVVRGEKPVGMIYRHEFLLWLSTWRASAQCELSNSRCSPGRVVPELPYSWKDC